MRLTTVLDEGRYRPVAVRDDDMVVVIDTRATGLAGIRALAAGGTTALARLESWLERQPAEVGTPLADAILGPAVPDPGAIYTIGLNYDDPAAPDAERPERPLVYGKAPSSVAGHGAALTWDRSVTANVDAECELGVVIGETAWAVTPGDALRHVFGYTIIDDVSSRDPWLDGDQWLIGKSMPGFCPVGPWVVTRDAIDPADIRLGCTVNGVAIQDDRTARMRTSIAEVIAYLSRHVELRPGDLIATGTPARLTGRYGPERHLQVGDVATAWIEGIGELTTTIR
ncbi:MAG: fumarylacetoacetate hydrolase family protein [Chloroflexota bacterium]|jgi:2-keto-4-pentenoate hydratase/2-oxohepta-3-ene-1,7-dioic acid hydratase in catechol pathway|nr:fumarylacetoacetate hydrolase family protein [Chloroflexota bacterium]MDH5242765.1 fumarylacetoacetate hydrolase family protein [Chloroflexota bacterium]